MELRRPARNLRPHAVAPAPTRSRPVRACKVWRASNCSLQIQVHSARAGLGRARTIRTTLLCPHTRSTRLWAVSNAGVVAIQPARDQVSTISAALFIASLTPISALPTAGGYDQHCCVYVANPPVISLGEIVTPEMRFVMPLHLVKGGLCGEPR